MAKNEKRVELIIPKIPGLKNDDFFVRVNGVAYQIPRGKKVMVPEYVKAEYERSMAAQDRYDETAKKHEYKDPVLNGGLLNLNE